MNIDNLKLKGNRILLKEAKDPFDKGLIIQADTVRTEFIYSEVIGLGGGTIETEIGDIIMHPAMSGRVVMVGTTPYKILFENEIVATITKD